MLTACVINASRYYGSVLRSFRDRDTEAIWNRERSRRLDGPTQRVAWRFSWSDAGPEDVEIVDYH
jgi:hypothetical protein